MTIPSKKIAIIAALAILLINPTEMSGATRSRKIPSFSQNVQAPIGDIRSLYIMLGHNMWCDWPTPMMGATPEEGIELIPVKRRPDLKLR